METHPLVIGQVVGRAHRIQHADAGLAIRAGKPGQPLGSGSDGVYVVGADPDIGGERFPGIVTLGEGRAAVVEQGQPFIVKHIAGCKPHQVARARVDDLGAALQIIVVKGFPGIAGAVEGVGAGIEETDGVAVVAKTEPFVASAVHDEREDLVILQTGTGRVEYVPGVAGAVEGAGAGIEHARATPVAAEPLVAVGIKVHGQNDIIRQPAPGIIGMPGVASAVKGITTIIQHAHPVVGGEPLVTGGVNGNSVDPVIGETAVSGGEEGPTVVAHVQRVGAGVQHRYAKELMAQPEIAGRVLRHARGHRRHSIGGVTEPTVVGLVKGGAAVIQDAQNRRVTRGNPFVAGCIHE